MSDLFNEKAYVIAEDPEGRLYFYINAKSDEPQKYPDPRILYDGKEHAILKRNPAQDIILDYINEDVRGLLASLHSVMVVESLNENITQAYYANMELVDSLPVEIIS
ncbi:MAG: hypothetical protein R3Y43_00300 [Alphaproteobacteria bacterium]